MKLDELQRLAEGATPGPWDAFTGGAGTVYSQVRLPTMSKPRAVCQCPSSRVDRTRSHADVAYIAAMSPDTAKKLIAVAKVVEEAHALVQEFKTRWMALPPFAEKINRATREGMTMAHQPIMQAEERLRTALEELKHGT